MTNVLSFEVIGEKDAAIVTPCIDGVLLTTLTEQFERGHGMTDPAGGYGGLIPAFFDHGPSLGQYFLGDFEVRIYVLSCDCGEVGCWPLTCIVDAGDSKITWHSFMQPHRPARDYSSFGPFVFERWQFEEALRGLPE